MKIDYCFLCINAAYLPNWVSFDLTREEYYQQLLSNCKHDKRWHERDYTILRGVRGNE